jgi:hypothetical protein
MLYSKAHRGIDDEPTQEYSQYVEEREEEITKMGK